MPLAALYQNLATQTLYNRTGQYGAKATTDKPLKGNSLFSLNLGYDIRFKRVAVNSNGPVICCRVTMGLWV